LIKGDIQFRQYCSSLLPDLTK